MQDNSFAIGAAVIIAIVLVVVGAYAISQSRAPAVAAVPGYTYPGYAIAPASHVSGPPYYIQRSVSPIVVTPPSTQPAFCTMDAKMCPDGSYVGRVPPTCQFAQCPLEL